MGISHIAIAAWADGLCPLTLDHASVLSAISSVRPASEPGEGGTSIGDAVGLALERLRGVADGAQEAGRERIKSRVLILLTDGENNSGELDPLTAFMAGRVEVIGDMTLVLQMQAVLMQALMPGPG